MTGRAAGAANGWRVTGDALPARAPGLLELAAAIFTTATERADVALSLPSLGRVAFLPTSIQRLPTGAVVVSGARTVRGTVKLRYDAAGALAEVRLPRAPAGPGAMPSLRHGGKVQAVTSGPSALELSYRSLDPRADPRVVSFRLGSGRTLDVTVTSFVVLPLAQPPERVELRGGTVTGAAVALRYDSATAKGSLAIFD